MRFARSVMCDASCFVGMLICSALHSFEAHAAAPGAAPARSCARAARAAGSGRRGRAGPRRDSSTSEPSLAGRLHAHPVGPNSARSHAAAAAVLDRQPRPASVSVSRSPAWRAYSSERDADAQPARGRRRPAPTGAPDDPERDGDAERHHAQRQVDGHQLARRDRAVAPQHPLQPGGRRALEHAPETPDGALRGARRRPGTGGDGGGHAMHAGRQRRRVRCGRRSERPVRCLAAAQRSTGSIRRRPRGRDSVGAQVLQSRMRRRPVPSAARARRLEARGRRRSRSSARCGRRHRRGAAAPASRRSRQRGVRKPGETAAHAALPPSVRSSASSAPAGSPRSASRCSWSITGSAKPACTSMSPRSCMSTNGVERRPPAAVAAYSARSSRRLPGRRSRTSGSRRRASARCQRRDHRLQVGQRSAASCWPTPARLPAGSTAACSTTASACGPPAPRRPPRRQARTLRARDASSGSTAMRRACG